MNKEGILKFNLDDFYSKESFTVAVHAEDFYQACLEMDTQLRQWIKYGHDFKTIDDALEAARQNLHDALHSKALSLEMMS